CARMTSLATTSWYFDLW
nr:immunoglobulin heavy chain junction region [Macaca mulatta]MOV92154.1 immunoglobulin heavy chain junction region [Macaca mulatta]